MDKEPIYYGYCEIHSCNYIDYCDSCAVELSED